MPESYADEYTMRLIAPSSPNPRVTARWVMPEVAKVVEAEEKSDDDEVEAKVVEAPKKRGRPRGTTKAQTK